MNAKSHNAVPAASAPSAYANVLVMPLRRERSDRDFGAGYGRSSGYAAAPRYVNATGLSRFRCA